MPAPRLTPTALQAIQEAIERVGDAVLVENSGGFFTIERVDLAHHTATAGIHGEAVGSLVTNSDGEFEFVVGSDT